MKVLVLNGPNLNMLGTRETDIYGSMSLTEIEKFTRREIEKSHKSVEQEWFQSNSESEIIDKIQQEKDSVDLIVINPAAYTHTSVAILDALKMVNVPIVEVHISNTNNREDFRSVKITTKSSTAVIEGMGYIGYYLAIKGFILKGS